MKQRFIIPNSYRYLAIYVIPCILLSVVIGIGFAREGSQQFSELALAFLHGHLYFLKSIGGAGQDPVLWHGKIYWDEGPFPAVLLMPFVGIFSVFHLFFYQGYLKWALVLGVCYFIYKLARHLSYSKEDSTILTFGFVLGSVFIGVASVSSGWLFAQVVTTFLLFWSFYEFYGRKRWWLIGIICGLVFLTRATASPISIFFLLELWQTVRKLHRTKKVKTLAQLCLPIVAAICFVGVYNYARFKSPLNGGYSYQLLHSASAESRSLGVFSLIHIPTNLYSALLRGPLPVLRDSTSWTLKFPYIKNNNYGMSIFITSPYFIYLFTKKWSLASAQCWHLIAALLVSCLLVFSYYGIGAQQFGYRYALDFLPSLFLLFMIQYRQTNTVVSRGMKFLLLGSGIFNFFLLWTFI